jgi:hypothetical protein
MLKWGTILAGLGLTAYVAIAFGPAIVAEIKSLATSKKTKSLPAKGTTK